MMKQTVILYILFFFLAAGCSGGSSSSLPSSAHNGEFPMISIPPSIQFEDERAEYLTLHFWDSFLDTLFTGSNDSLTVKGVSKQKIEEKFALWAWLLGEVSQETIDEAVETWLAGISLEQSRTPSSGIFGEMAALSSKYLNENASPLKSEKAYGSIAAKLAQSPLTDPSLVERYAFEAKICALNKEGTKAGDFSFTTSKGRQMRLYSVQAPLLLLVFSNPGCPQCEDIQKTISEDRLLGGLQDGGKLKIVNIYPDEDISSWRKAVKDYPSQWISGIDINQEIRNNLIYNIWAIPSLYLLDGDKTVILKDAPLEKVLEKIKKLSKI